MQKVTREVWKTAKDLFDRGYTAAQVMHLTNLSQATVYKIRNSTSYKGENGYIHYVREKPGRYDNIMNEYIETPPKPWWKKLKRGKK